MYHISTIRVLAAIAGIGLALLIAAVPAFGLAERADIVLVFDQGIALDGRHRLVIHYGLPPSCASIPNPPQHDCFEPMPQRREFSVVYLAPGGVRSLVWFRLPKL